MISKPIVLKDKIYTTRIRLPFCTGQNCGFIGNMLIKCVKKWECSYGKTMKYKGQNDHTTKKLKVREKQI